MQINYQCSHFLIKSFFPKNGDVENTSFHLPEISGHSNCQWRGKRGYFFCKINQCSSISLVFISRNISLLDISETFGTYDGSFVLYDNNLDSWKIYDLEEATKRIPPESTYKIYDALLGLESGIITPEHSSMTWNGDAFPFPSWEADQDLNSAMQNSVNWYFQAIDSQLGINRVQEFLNKIEYGNQTTSSNLDLYWSDFSLKISPLEQVTLLKKFNTNEFHLNSQNVFSVKNAIKIASTPNGNFYGKTGTGRVNGQDINGWFIGYVETSDNSYYFATNIQSDSNATGKKAFEITSDILKKLHIWN